MKLVGKVSLEELRKGAPIRVDYPPFDVVVALVGGAPSAIEDAGNHAGAGHAQGGLSTDRPECIVCPMHGYVFSMKTGELVAPRGLCGDQSTFVTKVVGEDVEIWYAFVVAIEKS